MVRSILVALDGSAPSRQAVQWGIRWSRRFDCLLVGMGVVDEPSLRGKQREVRPSYRAAYDQLLKEERHHVEQALEEFSVQCATAGVSSKVLQDEGMPLEHFMVQAQRFDMLMLGNQTFFQGGRRSEACKSLENLLRDAVRPIVTVPQALPSSEARGTLVAYDGSIQAARALQVYLSVGLAELGPVWVASADRESRVEAARTADRAVEFLRFHDVEARPLPLVSMQPADAFLAAAGDQGAEVVVMGAYGKSRLADFFLGSATCTALARSPIPLFLYH